MRSSQVNIPWVAWKSSVETMMSSTEAIQRVAVPTLQVEILMGGGAVLALQVEIPMVAATARCPDRLWGRRASRLTRIRL
jgi:hypothetical protein